MKREQIVNIFLSSWLTHKNTHHTRIPFLKIHNTHCISCWSLKFASYIHMRIWWHSIHMDCLSLSFIYRIFGIKYRNTYKVASTCSHFVTSYRIITIIDYYYFRLKISDNHPCISQTRDSERAREEAFKMWIIWSLHILYNKYLLPIGF